MNKTCILVAEDNLDVLDSLSRLLELEGFNVIRAENCLTALEHLSQIKPNVILTDLAMPGMTGLELIQRVRRMPECAQIPIIAMTAHTSKYLSAAIDAGADVAIHKLEGFDTLLEKINEVLDEDTGKRKNRE